MKHSAPATFDTECSVHDMSYVRYCSLTMKKSVSKTEKKKIPYFTELSFFWKYGMECAKSVTEPILDELSKVFSMFFFELLSISSFWKEQKNP